MDKTAEYLRLLQEKNRLKKMMSTKSKDEQAKEELEKGFTTHFRGAHAAKDSKMPIPTKTTASVKPINILGRIAQGANIMWGHEKKGEVTSPNSAVSSGKDKTDSRNRDTFREIGQEDREEGNHFSEYESDFDDCSDAETDPKAQNTHRITGLPMPSVIEEDESDFFGQHNAAKETDVSHSDGHRNNPLAESVALDSTLQTRVKDLSAQQKLKLLKLLELDLGEDAGTAPPAKTAKLAREMSPMTLEDVITPITENVSPAGGGFTAVQKETVQGKQQHHMRSEHPSHTESVFGHQQQQVHPQMNEHEKVGLTSTVSLRIRITTTWSAKARFVNLGAVRLRLRTQGGRVGGGGESSAVDVLPLLTARACSGLAPLPNGSEAMRLLPQLVGVNSGGIGGGDNAITARRPASAYRGPVGASATGWKGPISPDSPLELQFSGELSVTVLDGCLGLEDLELLVWNSSSSAVPLNSACARDVDVFVGSRCVWSGQIDENESSTALLATTVRPGELAPSLALFPWRSPDKKPAVSQARNDEKAPQHQQQQQQQEQQQHNLGFTSADPGRSHLKTDSHTNDEVTSAATDKPNWLGKRNTSDTSGSATNQSNLFSDAGSPLRASTKNTSGRTRLRASEVSLQHSEPTTVSDNISDTTLAFGSPKRRVSAAGKRVSNALAKGVEREDLLVKGGTGLGRQGADIAGGKAEASDDEDAVDSKTKASPSPNPSPSGARRRAARRDRQHLLKEAQGTRGDHNNNNSNNDGAGMFDEVTPGGYSPERKIANKKQREAELKKSIDSMAFNDKFNLGRLSASKLPYVRSGQSNGYGSGNEEDNFPVLAPSSYNVDNFGDDSLDGPSTPLQNVDFTQIQQHQQHHAGLLSPSKKDKAMEKEKEVLSPQRKLTRNASSASVSTTASSSGQQQQQQQQQVSAAEDAAARAIRDSDRTAKIDLVQEKITSTIAGLAKIMSAIPSGGISLAKNEPAATKLDFPVDAAQQYTPPRPFPVRAAALSPKAEKSQPAARSDAVKPPAEVKPWHRKEKGAEAASTLKSSVASTSISSPHTFVVEIDSNWGDANYVGLNGLELYDNTGTLIQLQTALSSAGGRAGAAAGVRAITAYPKDLTDLPEHRDDPRKVQNLLNGINFTKNDLHSWLAPHLQVLRRTEDASAAHNALPYIARVVLELDPVVVPVMCRVFNYNRSRTRNQRGAKRIKLFLDNNIVFEGDLKKATGQLQSVESESEVLFLDAQLSESAKAALRAHLVRCRERGLDEDAEEEYGEVSADLDEQQQHDQLEQSWAELSMSRPKTSAGVVPPPAQSQSSFTANAASVTASSPASAAADYGNVFDAAASARTGPQNERSVTRESGPTFNEPLVSASLFVSNEQHRTDVQKAAATNEPPAAFGYALPQKGEGVTTQLPTASDGDGNVARGAVASSSSSFSSLPSSSSSGAGSTTRTMVSAPCRVLRLNLLSTWGDASYIGLCGLEVLVGPSFAPAKIGTHQLRAQPKDLSDIGCYDDPRVLGNLINGINNTADDTAMWIIPFTQGSEHFIEVDLQGLCDVVGIRVWNYNKSSEQVLRGCRQLAISADGRLLCECLLRVGPGTDGVCFGQTILFSELADILQGAHPHYAPPSRLRPGQQREARLTSYLSPAVRQDFETPLNPTGLLWKFTFFDNWNDGYYIGLDALEFFDSAGRLIDMAAVGAQVQAVPYSIQDLASNSQQQHYNDPRTPSQLFSRLSKHSSGSGSGDGQPDSRCWLAPLARCMTPAERAVCVRRALQGSSNSSSSSSTASTAGGGSADAVPSLPLNNVLFVLFQHPISVSAIRLFNYSKTPSRGVRDFQVEVDGLYLYMGSLLRADKEKYSPHIVSKTSSATPSAAAAAAVVVAGKPGISRGQSVLFTNDPKILQVHRETVSYCGAGEQDVLCINERQVMVRSKNMYDQEPPNTSLEGVRSDLDKRPMTAAVHHGGARAPR